MYYCIPFGSDNTGGYSVLGLCIVPPCSRANTATLELNIPLYCPPSHAIIHMYQDKDSNSACTVNNLIHSLIIFATISSHVGSPSRTSMKSVNLDGVLASRDAGG